MVRKSKLRGARATDQVTNTGPPASWRCQRRPSASAASATSSATCHTCPEYERMLVRSGIVLVKCWFSVGDAEQERPFPARTKDPTKRWKLSLTDIQQAPWYVVNADDQERARLDVIGHLLSPIACEDLRPEPIALPAREPDTGYIRPPLSGQTFIPEVY